MRGGLEIGLDVGLCVDSSLYGLFSGAALEEACTVLKENLSLKRRGPSFSRLFMLKIGVCIRQVGQGTRGMRDIGREVKLIARHSIASLSL
jgi:hypothetical protein